MQNKTLKDFASTEKRKEILYVKLRNGLRLRAEQWILDSDGAILINPKMWVCDDENGNILVPIKQTFGFYKIYQNEVERVVRIKG